MDYFGEVQLGRFGVQVEYSLDADYFGQHFYIPVVFPESGKQVDYSLLYKLGLIVEERGKLLPYKQVVDYLL